MENLCPSANKIRIQKYASIVIQSNVLYVRKSDHRQTCLVCCFTQMLLLSILLLSQLLLQPANGITYYVSSSTGLPNNDGLTKQTASSDLQAMINKGSGNDILLCQGDTIRINPFTINHARISLGTYVCNLAKQGIKPIITAGRLITEQPTVSTTMNGLPMWSFDISRYMTVGSVQYQLLYGVWIGDTRYMPARFPNLVDPLVLHGQNRSEFAYLRTCSSNTVRPPLGLKNVNSTSYWLGSVVRLRGYDWSYQRNVISAITNNNGNMEWTLDGITVASNTNPCPGFYLEHKGMGELDARGEFWFDQQTRRLHLVPMVSADPAQIWLAPGTNSSFPQPEGFYFWMINYADRSYMLSVAASATSFRATGLAFQWWLGAISISGPTSHFVDCSFSNLAHTGIKSITPFSITTSSFSRVDYFGINTRVAPGWANISFSKFEDVGLTAGYADMPFGASGFMHARSNQFIRMGYGGLNPATQSIAEENTFDMALMALSDGAAIYSGSSRIQLRRNTILNVRANTISSHGMWTIGNAMYADTCSSHWIMEDNFVRGIAPMSIGGAVYLHDSGHHWIARNRFESSTVIAIYDSGNACEPYNITLLENAFVPAPGTQGLNKYLDFRFHVVPSGYVINPVRSVPVARNNVFCRGSGNHTGWNPVSGLSLNLEGNTRVSNGKCFPDTTRVSATPNPTVARPPSMDGVDTTVVDDMEGHGSKEAHSEQLMVPVGVALGVALVVLGGVGGTVVWWYRRRARGLKAYSMHKLIGKTTVGRQESTNHLSTTAASMDQPAETPW